MDKPLSELIKEYKVLKARLDQLRIVIADKLVDSIDEPVIEKVVKKEVKVRPLKVAMGSRPKQAFDVFKNLNKPLSVKEVAKEMGITTYNSRSLLTRMEKMGTVMADRENSPVTYSLVYKG